MDRNWYREQAKQIIKKTAGLIDVEPNAEVSKPPCPPNGPGAWVQCWLWVPDPENTHVETIPVGAHGT